MSKITKIIPRDDLTLEIELNNSNTVIYNMKNRVDSIRFSKLKDFEVFKSFKVENDRIIVWDKFCMITIDEILDDMGR
jgi:limonene-1,2-epoxide hydrolase